MPARGFTVVELIAVILIAGILAAVAAPRFFSGNTFAGKGYYDEAASFLRYAQKLAIARHATHYVQVDTNSGLTLCAVVTTPCPSTSQVTGPDGSTPYQARLPSGVTLAGSSFSYDDLGRPSASRTFTITGDDALTLTVEAETGYVH